MQSQMQSQMLSRQLSGTGRDNLTQRPTLALEEIKSEVRRLIPQLTGGAASPDWAHAMNQGLHGVHGVLR
jgi:hypothetical protein